MRPLSPARPRTVLVAGALLLCGSLPTAAGRLDPDLRDALQRLEPDQELSVLLSFEDGLDPFAITAGAGPKAVSRTRLVRSLLDQAARSEEPVRRLLRQSAGQARVTSLWAVHGAAVTAPVAAVRRLADAPGVEEVRLDRSIRAPRSALAAPAAAEWNIEVLHAPALWAQGHDGSGAVVAVVDTGVDALHQDLAPRWRGGSNSWFDPNGEHGEPHDTDGHGTQVAGVIVAGDAGGTAVGVAPGARWIGVKIFDDAGVATLGRIHEGLQWLLDPDGDPSTDDAPDVVNNSWGFQDQIGECYSEFEPDLAVLRAAGIAVVFSAGNAGPAPATSVSPANNPGALAVGGVDQGGAVIRASSRGPSACTGGVFPAVAAPGDGIRTTDLTLGGVFPDQYVEGSGTSLAAPQVAGALALLLTAHPGASLDQLERALRDTASDLGPAGPDPDSGHGLVDISAASSMLAGLVGNPPNAVVYTDEGAFLAAVSHLQVLAEGFEDDGVWGGARLPSAVTSVTSQGITWTSNYPTNRVTTGPGPARSGEWGFYSQPHGDPAATDPFDFLRDGFGGTGDGTLEGVGGWFTGTAGSRLAVILDGDGANPVDLGPFGSAHQFFGVVVAGGFATFEFRETDGTLEDPKLVFVDDVTFAVAAGSTNNPPDGTITEPVSDVEIAPGGSVSFTGMASDPDGDPVSVQWDFGDGTGSSQLVPGDHVYRTLGSFTVALTATDDHGLSDPTPGTRTVTVVDPSVTQMTGAVAGVADVSGAQGSDWHTDLYLHNAASNPATVELYFSPGGDGPGSPVQVSVEPDSTLSLEDVVNNEFGTQGSGVINWRLPAGDGARMLVSGNTYNRVDAVRRYGQQVPGLRWSDAAPTGTPVSVPALAGRYRTNLGVATDGSCTQVRVQVFDRLGVLKAERVLTLVPWSWTQLNDLFRAVFPNLLDDPDATPVADSLHRVEVVGLDGRVAVYASIIDNVTNDASYLVGQWTAQAAGTAWLPGAAETLGVNGSQWRSDVVVMNPDDAPLTVELAFHGENQVGGSVPDVRTVTLAGQESRFEGDVLDTLFGYVPPAVGSLESRGAAGSRPLVWMRTYTEEVDDVGASVTFGQAIQPRATQTMVAPAQEGRVVGFSHGQSARSNLILQNTRADSAGGLLGSDVRVDVLDAAGHLVHQRTYSLGPGEYLQHNGFIADYGLSAIDAGTLRIVLLNAGSTGENGGVDAMVSEVNGNSLPGTNDGRLVRADIVPRPGR